MIKRVVYEKDGFKLLRVLTDIYSPGEIRDYYTGFWPDGGARNLYDYADRTLTDIFEALQSGELTPNLPPDVEAYYRAIELPKAETKQLPDFK